MNDLENSVGRFRKDPRVPDAARLGVPVDQNGTCERGKRRGGQNRVRTDPGMLNRIVSIPDLALASRIACRSEPGPESNTLVTSCRRAARYGVADFLYAPEDVPVRAPTVTIVLPGNQCHLARCACCTAPDSSGLPCRSCRDDHIRSGDFLKNGVRPYVVDLACC